MVDFTDDGLFPDEDLTALDYGFDGLNGLARGAEGFLQSGYSLLDALTFDALPDYEKRFLGESRTAAGSTVELITQFALGFAAAPLAVAKLGGVVGAVGKVRGLGALTSVGTKIKRGSDALRGTGLVANAARGAVADFAFLETQDTILGGLSEELGFNEELGGFLGASPEELGFFEGRLRNALEGLALGGAVDGLMIGAKKIKAFRGGKAAGEKAAAKAVDDVASETAGESIEESVQESVEEGLKRKEELTTRLKKPTEAEKTSKELVEQYGSPLRRPFKRGDLAQVDGEGDSFTTQLVNSYLDGDIDVIAAMKDGRGDELSQLLKTAVDADVQLAGLSELAGRVPEDFDDFVLHAKSVLAESNNLTMTEAGAFYERLQVNGADNARAARSAFIASQVFIAGAEKSINKGMRRFIDAGNFDGAVELYADSALALSRALQGGHVLMSEFGSGLRAGGFAKTDRATFAQLSDEMLAIKDSARSENVAQRRSVKAIKRHLAMVDESGVRRATSTLTNSQKGLNVLQELYTNNLLAGIRTLTVTGIGGGTMLFMRPAERFLGNVVTGQFVTAHREWRRYWSTVNRSFREAVKYAKASFKEESNILDPGQASMFGSTAPRSIELGGGRVSFRAIDTNAKGTIPNIIRAVGQVVRVPQRSIGFVDQFYRQLGSRAEMAIQLDAMARKTGIVDEIAVDAFIKDKMKIIVKDGRILTDGALQERFYKEAIDAGVPDEIARQNAREKAQAFRRQDKEGLLKVADTGIEAGNKVAFTERFDKESIAGAGQTLLNKLPAAKFVIPFYSTPIQILGASIERSLAAVPVDVMRAMFKGESRILKELRDPALRAAAAGRLTVGATSAALVFDMVDQGLMTGGGPVDIGQKRALEATGWRPYSVKVDDTYFSFARLDPIASIFGLYADIREAISMHDPAQEDLVGGMFNASLVALNGNFVEKTYMRGLSDFFDIFDRRNGERNAKRYLSEIGANTTGPGVLRNFSEWGRPEVVQVHDMWSRMAKRWSFLPGVDNPEPFRNILGEAIDSRRYLGNGSLPIEYSVSSSDVISGEIARLGFGIQPDPFSKNGVNLKEFNRESGQSAYDRWQQLKGQVKVQGRTLTDTLSRTIRSRRYRNLPDEEEGLLELGLTSPKEQQLRVILSRFRAQAYKEMLEDFPELQDREFLRRRTQRRARQGRL